MDKKRKLTNTKGFTLVELIVILVILSLLAAMLAPSLNSYIDKARRQSLISSCRNCVIATQSILSGEYAYSEAEIPTNEEILTLAGLINSGGSVSDIELIDKTVKVHHLTYTNRSGRWVKYCHDASCGAIFNFDDGETDNNVGLFYNPDDDTPNSIFINAYESALASKKITAMGKSAHIDSTAINSNRAKYVIEAMGNDIDTTNIKSWAIISENGHKVCWFSDVDITKVEPGSSVRVIRYNPNYNTYTAGYMQVELWTENGATYNRFVGGTNQTVWSEYSGVSQDDTTKANYEATLEIFNEMPLSK